MTSSASNRLGRGGEELALSEAERVPSCGGSKLPPCMAAMITSCRVSPTTSIFSSLKPFVAEAVERKGAGDSGALTHQLLDILGEDIAFDVNRVAGV